MKKTKDRPDPEALAIQLIQLIDSYNGTDEPGLLKDSEDLIKAGALISYKDQNCLTVLDWAKFGGYDILVLRLCEALKDHKDIRREVKRELLEQEINRTACRTTREELNLYWEDIPVSSADLTADKPYASNMMHSFFLAHRDPKVNTEVPKSSRSLSPA